MLTHRDRAILGAVAAGRVQVACGCMPDLFIDGLCCCDQFTAHRLVWEGLVQPVTSGSPGCRVGAVLTAVGEQRLALTR